MVQRASISLAASALLLLAPAPALAQVDGAIVLNILRECAKIGDPTARLACYDNNIRSAGGTASQAQAPVSAPAPLRSSPGNPPAPVVPATTGGFGGESVRTIQQPAATAAAAPDQVNEINARVARINQREPGVYLVELDDGAQWLFNESVSRSYRVPRAGSTVEIERASMGSFLLRFDSQQAVRVRRVR